MVVNDADQFQGWDTVSEAVVGEITTRLLLTSEPLPSDAARGLLAELRPGSRAERAGHPVERVVSADLPFGVDCRLATPSNVRVRAIGVAAAHAILTGGHVVQGSAYARVVQDETGTRQRWSHYSARPGYVEAHGESVPRDLTAAFLTAPGHPELLDLAGVGKQVIDRVHNDPMLDRRPRWRTRPLQLRWTARLAALAGLPEMEFVRYEDGSFLIDAVAAPEHLPALMRFVEDVALHVWLSSTMTWALEHSVGKDDKLAELGPALEYLGHLWSPGQTTDEVLDYLWASVEARLHLSRSWHSQLTRVRDQIAMLTLQALQARVPKDENVW